MAVTQWWSILTKELSVPDREALRLQVQSRWLKGNKQPGAIAKELGLKRVEVMDLIAETKEIWRNDPDVKERAKEVLQEVEAGLDIVIDRSWETVEQADNTSDLKTKATVLKNIADVQFKRVEMHQKAGLYDDAALGDELAEMEEKQAILVAILKEVTADCAHCSYEVARRLERVTNKTEPVFTGDVVVVQEDDAPSA
jgi:hypothetical protein